MPRRRAGSNKVYNDAGIRIRHPDGHRVSLLEGEGARDGARDVRFGLAAVQDARGNVSEYFSESLQRFTQTRWHNDNQRQTNHINMATTTARIVYAAQHPADAPDAPAPVDAPTPEAPPVAGLEQRMLDQLVNMALASGGPSVPPEAQTPASPVRTDWNPQADAGPSGQGQAQPPSPSIEQAGPSRYGEAQAPQQPLATPGPSGYGGYQAPGLPSAWAQQTHYLQQQQQAPEQAAAQAQAATVQETGSNGSEPPGLRNVIDSRYVQYENIPRTTDPARVQNLPYYDEDRGDIRYPDDGSRVNGPINRGTGGQVPVQFMPGSEVIYDGLVRGVPYYDRYIDYGDNREHGPHRLNTNNLDDVTWDRINPSHTSQESEQQEAEQQATQPRRSLGERVVAFAGEFAEEVGDEVTKKQAVNKAKEVAKKATKGRSELTQLAAEVTADKLTGKTVGKFLSFLKGPKDDGKDKSKRKDDDRGKKSGKGGRSGR